MNAAAWVTLVIGLLAFLIGAGSLVVGLVALRRASAANRIAETADRRAASLTHDARTPKLDIWFENYAGNSAHIEIENCSQIDLRLLKLEIQDPLVGYASPINRFLDPPGRTAVVKDLKSLGMARVRVDQNEACQDSAVVRCLAVSIEDETWNFTAHTRKPPGLMIY